MVEFSLKTEWRTANIAYVALRRGAAAPDAGAPWPAANCLNEKAGLILANVAPGAALAIGAPEHGQWAENLSTRIGDKAIVTDQSGAYCILRLEGAAARDILASGIFIDLDPEAFPAGSAAAVRCGHITVILLHLAGGVFDVLVPRSYVESFKHWLQASSAMQSPARTAD